MTDYISTIDYKRDTTTSPPSDYTTSMQFKTKTNQEGPKTTEENQESPKATKIRPGTGVTATNLQGPQSAEANHESLKMTKIRPGTGVTTTNLRVPRVTVSHDDGPKETSSSADDTVNAMYKHGCLPHLAPPVELTASSKITSLNHTHGIDLKSVIDHGSGRSYIVGNASVFDNLPLSPLEHAWIIQFADQSRHEVKRKLRGFLTIFSTNGEDEFKQQIELLVIETSDINHEVHIILGRDLIQLFQIDTLGATIAQIRGVRICETDELSVSNMNLADIVRNINMPTFEDPIATIPLTLVSELAELHPSQKEDSVLFEMDRAGVKIGLEKSEQSEEDELPISFIKEDSAPKGRAVIDIAWTSSERPQVNFAATVARDRKVLAKLSNAERTMFTDAINQLIDGGFASEIPDKEPLEGHYIAVRPVFKIGRSTTKCRLCLDARGINALTRIGPQNGMTMINNLILFRTTPHVATFDLTKAFWQVKLADHACKYYSTVVCGKRIRFNRMVFGGNFSPAGLECTLQRVLQAAKEHLTTAPPQESELNEPTRPNAEALKVGYYVDDFHVRAEDGESLRITVQWLRWFLNCYGFASDKLRFSGSEPSDWDNYLSYKWNSLDDLIRPKEFGAGQLGEHCSKAMLASQVMRLFDPLGLQLRLQLAGRSVIRQAFTESNHADKSNTWKQSISSQLKQQLEEWISASKLINATVALPRFVDACTLHVFCDASFQAWAFQVHGTKFELLLSKGGLVKNGFTIPRAELTALHAAVEEVTRLPLSDMKVSRIYFLTDNEACVHRLRNPSLDRNLKVYERNRVVGIRNRIETFKDCTIEIIIKHIPGAVNLADAPTRPFPILQETRRVDLAELEETIQSTTGYVFDGVTKEAELETTFAGPFVDSVLMMSAAGAQSAINMQNGSTDRDEIARRNQQLLPTEIRERLIDSGSGILKDASGRTILYNADKNSIGQLIMSVHLPSHCGITATIGSLKRFKLFWKGMQQDVTVYWYSRKLKK